MRILPLSEVCDIQMGQAPPGSSYNENGEGVPLIAGAGDFGETVPNPSKFTTSASRLSEPNEIILCIRATIGDRNWSNQTYCLGRGVAGLKAKENVLDRQYLWHWLETAKSELVKQARGSTFKQIDKKSIQDIKITLPPIAEQKRIAAILDKADSVRRKRKEAIALTEELLRSAFLEMFGDPITNPKGWEVKPLGEIAQFIGGGTPSRKVARYFEGDICWATSKDMNIDVLVDTQEHITEEAIENSATKLVQPECLLIVVKSKVLMRRLPVARTAIPVCFGQDLKAIIPFNREMTRYLHRHLQIGQKILLEQARGVNTEGLTLEHLRSFPVMMPALSEIKEFVAVDLQIGDSCKSSVAVQEESENLFNSLLQRAFRGEL